jgi:hypothetical protein
MTISKTVLILTTIVSFLVIAFGYNLSYYNGKKKGFELGYDEGIVTGYVICEGYYKAQ